MNLSWYDKVMLVVVLVCFTTISKMIFDLKKSNNDLKSLQEENATLREAIKRPATTTEPSVKYITKTQFIRKEIPSEKEQEYVNKIKELLNNEKDYKNTIDSLYAMFYTGETSQEVTVTGGQTSTPLVPIFKPETPQMTTDFKLSMLAEYNTDNTYGIGLGYNYKRLTIGAKGDNKNNFGVFGLWRFWR